MDFGALLHIAKRNSESSKNEGKYYSTKFAPPKKESKDKRLSDNIQRFLQKREQEEREKQRREKEKVANLLAMRDEKSKNKIKKMLKVTKSANKSVLDDAVNADHTAVTMQGPEQPDADDYGYVSKEANALYAKYIEKVKDVKEDKGFAPSRPQTFKDIAGTKERVKAAIDKEIEDKKHPTRKTHASSTSKETSSASTSSSVARAYTTSKNVYDPEAERREEERKKREEELEKKKAKARKPAPPPLDFHALLKLAEKKQHEPVLVPIVEKKEPERLLTMKEKRELEERQRAKEERERRKRERDRAPTNNINSGAKPNKDNASPRMEPNGRIPKLNQASKPNATSSVSAVSSASKIQTSPGAHNSKNQTSASTHAKPSTASSSNKVKNAPPTPTSHSGKSSSHSSSHSNTLRPSTSTGKATPSSISSAAARQQQFKSPAKPIKASPAHASKAPTASVSKNPYTGPTREFPPRDMKNVKTREFPPADVRKSSQNHRHDDRRPQLAAKRPIIESDDEDDEDDEYDSELDDFIDDGEDEEDVSSHIKAIFGYDKSRYRDIDEEDDAAMESNFAQQQREEYISKKIGIQEDLEEMRLEAMEKKRKKRRMN